LSSDIKLLGYVAAALFFSMALMLILTLRQAGRVRGADQWLWGTLTIAIAVALNTLQQIIPPFLGLVVSNVLLIMGAAMSARGSYEYRYHVRIAARWGALPLTVAAIALAYYVYVQPSVAARVLIIAFAVGIICSWHAWILIAGSALRRHAKNVKHARFVLAHAMMVAGLVMMIVGFATRFAETLQNLHAVIPPGGVASGALLFYSMGLAGRILLLIGMVLVLIDELDHKLRTLALLDSLTGLLNRRGFMGAVGADELTRCAVLMLDLDRFKDVNDDFGHEQGDRVISLFARCAAANLPANAVLARLGGEEFCALLPGLSLSEATDRAETLRQTFTRESSALNHSRQHTVSIGVAATESTPQSLLALIRRADRALYEAKREGRNRVVVEAVTPLPTTAIAQS
jgi:diguanylate cyclase (GGDEF)-like protein